jgi:hypothetical protein
MLVTVRYNKPCFEISLKHFLGVKKMAIITTTCGIYETEYTLINHRDGSISVKAPYIKWINNNGSLAFKTIKIDKFSEQAKLCFLDDDLSEMTISEIVDINWS